jgi:hypothetical protein
LAASAVPALVMARGDLNQFISFLFDSNKFRVS